MKRLLRLAVMSVALALPTTMRAAEEKAPNSGGLAFSGGVDWVSAYYFRGYEQEDSGFIAQPYLTMSIKAYSSDQLSITPYIGTWNSFHENETLTDGSGPDAWYESDLFGGVDIGMGKFTLGAVYTFYMYPNGAFETIEEFGLKLSYDDTDAMKSIGIPFALKPYVAWYHEIDDGNGTEDEYLEIGAAPSFPIGDTKFTLALPMALGLSTDGYYLDNEGHNDFWGYGSVGAMLSYPLYSGKFGTWTLTGGVTYIHLFSDSLEAANDNDDNDWIAKVGIAFSY